MVPKVSVVMSVYNAAAFLFEAVQSVLAQSFGDFEFIIINDGSSDNSGAILAKFTDPRIKVLNQENRGLVASLNRGIEVATGDYIARMDADDRCTPDRFQRQVNCLNQHADIALLGGAIATMDQDGEPLAPCVMFPPTHDRLWLAIGRKPWVFCHPAVMFRRQAAIDVGLYSPNFAHAEDTEFFARLMTRHGAANLPDVLLHYRLTRGAVSFAKRDHGRINAELVATIIDCWKPGQPFIATVEQRRAADLAIQASAKPTSAAKAEAAYEIRIGRELLRGRQWSRAAIHYTAAVRNDCLNRKAYTGLACALLRVGGVRN